MDNLSRHASVRSQQRGIPPPVIETLLDYGRETHDHRGGRILYFDHQARRHLRRQLGDAQYRQMERHLGTYAVLAVDGEVLTVGHRQRRINRH